MFFPKSPLFDETAEGTGGGGGASAAADEHAAGDGQQQQDPPQQQPPALTLDALKDLLTGQANTLKGEFTKQINGLDAKFKKQFEQRKEPAKTEAMTAEQMLDAFKRESEERIANIEREREEERKVSRQRDMDSEVKSALSEFAWTSDAKGVMEGRDIAFSYYSPRIQPDDDGKLMIGGMPLQAYIKEDCARRFKPFHQARNVGGSGNSSGKASAPPTIMNETLFNKTRSGEQLSADERTAVRADIVAQLANQLRPS